MRTIKNPIERRLHEVEDSRAELRAEIKRLERALKKPERLLEYPHLLPTTRPSAPRVRIASSPTTPVEPGATEPAVATEPTVEGLRHRGSVSVTDDRFRRYFASTRFFGPPALGRERNVQRNRAILLLVGALILGFIVFRLVFH
jgi:hypothetical protein